MIARDQIRLLIGDTDVDDQLLADAQVDEFLAHRSVTTTAGSITYNVIAAAADCAGAIAAKYAREFNFAEDNQRFDRAQRVGHYQALEKTLRNRSGGFSANVVLAGTATS